MSSGDHENEVITMRRQRSLAVACLVMALALAGAVVSSNFGDEPNANRQAREQVELHRQLHEQELKVRLAHEAYVVQLRSELEKLKQAAASR